MDQELKVIRPVNAEIKSEKEVIVNNTVYTGKVIDCSGWKGKAKWIKAIEEVREPITDDKITVFIDSKNPGGFSWIVPLPDKTLIGSLSYLEPRNFLPNLDKRLVETHGGGIPRVKPIRIQNIPTFGDRTGLIKTFTGGGIFGIAELISSTDYKKTFSELSKEVRKQYYLTLLVEKTWKTWLYLARIYKDKTIRAEKEFDFHSMLLFSH
ncbi:NAD(P)/FAD-dependent oxidoreductase [Acidianus sp. HS-5]|uniref:NAD(P)/FAD-dependent oxidoreductase n=1 Tax=Acidianus sp. HS-5 TaxID=2886040 RepID=UPI001F41D19A|nr:NAD(P)/FAD-dependent oxidoreductase [Acidianus sp. HS-5]